MRYAPLNIFKAWRASSAGIWSNRRFCPVDVATVESQELKTVAVLALGFGLVGIDRFLISTLYPVIAHDLGLGYADIGTITGALAFAWGSAALFMGNLSDYIGRRRVLVFSLIAFSIMIGASGLAGGVAGLVVVRVLMGFADGAYTPASISATLEASPDHRHGRNIGLQQMTLTFFGLGLSPLFVSLLLHLIDWRWIFLVFVLPGLLLAWTIWRVLPASSPRPAASKVSPLADWRGVLGYGNVRILMLGMSVWITCLITTSALLPSYLLDHLNLGFGQMGTVMSAIGIGAATGTLLLPWLSDRTGRKPVMIAGTLGATAALVCLASVTTGDVKLLFACVFGVHFFNNSLITLTVGPICSETVPPALSATACGVIVAVGELVGGGVAPILAGRFAESFGIEHLLWLPTGAMVLGFVLCLLLKETRPT